MNSNITRMTTSIKGKLIESDRQTNIDKYRVIARKLLQISLENLSKNHIVIRL